jgi:hypothetical protein
MTGKQKGLLRFYLSFVLWVGGGVFLVLLLWFIIFILPGLHDLAGMH